MSGLVWKYSKFTILSEGMQPNEYQSFNKNTIENLQNRQIWFSKPESSNDPFDCAPLFLIKNLTHKEFEQVYKNLRNRMQNEFDSKLFPGFART